MKRSVVVVMLSAALLGSLVTVHAQEAGEPVPAAVTMAKTMDPNSWLQLMGMAMDPRIWSNPISSCAACHDNEDVGRYQQVFGPYVGMMMNPASWATTDSYTSALASAMDPAAAEHWARALEKKYGLGEGTLVLGAANGQNPIPTVHGAFWWPWAPPPASAPGQ